MIPAWVSEYVGIPFLSLGRDRAGVDCWGLVRLVYREQLGCEIPSYSESYASAYDRDEVEALIRNRVAATPWAPIAEESAQLGDLILFRCAARDSHIGIVVAPDEKKFLHAQDGADSSCPRYDSIQWRNRVTGFYRYAR